MDEKAAFRGPVNLKDTAPAGINQPSLTCYRAFPHTELLSCQNWSDLQATFGNADLLGNSVAFNN